MANEPKENLFDEEAEELLFEEIDLGDILSEEKPEDAPGKKQKKDSKKKPVSKKAAKKERKKEKRQRKEAKRQAHPGLYNFLDWVKVIVVAIIVACFLNYFVMINSRVPSGSMEPTIMTGSRMMGFRLSYTLSDPERGDIIIFRYPDDESIYYVKRIIGLPGETIEIKDGFVYVDGEILSEDYLTVTTEGSFGPYVVPEGCYFVLGDNRNNSHDSRYWENTYVPEENILGKALFCYWPVSEIGILK